MACRLLLYPSVYSTALRGGCNVFHPAWLMLVVLDCAVCLQLNKRRLLLLLLLLLLAVSCAREYSVVFADIADKPGSGRNGDGQHRSISCSANLASFAPSQSSITLGRHEG